ncbi:MAG: SlyX family protein [Mariprofundaceae bacterium]|nr:SlyX family protein [Mariprofundaceae bacterium]
MNIEQGIIELQTKYAYQEDLLQSLNEVVTQQQQELVSLKEDLKRMQASLRGMMGSQLARPDEEVPPPHY